MRADTGAICGWHMSVCSMLAEAWP